MKYNYFELIMEAVVVIQARGEKPTQNRVWDQLKGIVGIKTIEKNWKAVKESIKNGQIIPGEALKSNPENENLIESKAQKELPSGLQSLEYYIESYGEELGQVMYDAQFKIKSLM
jgi:hypothetical protein